MRTRLSRATGKEQADRQMGPMTGGHHPLSSASKLTLPHHGSDWEESTAWKFLVFLGDMFRLPMPSGHDPEPADPWFDYLVDYAEVDSEVRTCYAMWDALLRVEHSERETQATDLRDTVRRLVQARREIMDVLHRDATRQADVMRALLDAAQSATDDMPAKQAVSS